MVAAASVVAVASVVAAAVPAPAPAPALVSALASAPAVLQMTALLPAAPGTWVSYRDGRLAKG